MKAAREIYIIIWLIPISLSILYITGLIPHIQPYQNSVLSYILSLITVVGSLAAAYLSLRLFRFPPISRRLREQAEDTARRIYSRLCILRETAILILNIIDMSTYYAFGNVSQLYLAGIMLITLVFCFPQESELSSLTNKHTLKP